MVFEVPGGLTWPEVARRLEPALIYWLVTSDADDGPHVAPVWGAVIHDDLYVYSERATRKARNLQRDPRAVVHLESGSDVVIVHGQLDDVGHPMDFRQVVDALAAKYSAPDQQQYLPSVDPHFDVLYLFRPQRGLVWMLSDYESSQRRWKAAARHSARHSTS